MSHHLDSPLALQDARLDITDLYVFPGATGTVLVLDVCPSAAGADAPGGFHPEARYEFRIDTDADAVEDLTYRFTFGPADGSGRQELELRRLTGAQAADPAAAGTVLARGTTGETITGGAAGGEAGGGPRLWAGRAHDPFWIEPSVLRAVGAAFAAGTRIDLSGWDPASASNLFADGVIHSVVLEVPDSELLAAAADERRLHVWGLTALATDSGGWRPVNRAGLPMVHSLFAQHDGPLGDRLNATPPADDARTHGKAVADMVAGVVAAHGSARDPAAYGRAVAGRLCPNVLPYTVGTPAVFGFAEWNGRWLGDDAPAVMFSLASNTALGTGLNRRAVPYPPAETFPYVRPARWDRGGAAAAGRPGVSPPPA